LIEKVTVIAHFLEAKSGDSDGEKLEQLTIQTQFGRDFNSK
jgi:hypothetical protein